MAIKRKPLKPVKGWVVVGPAGDIPRESIHSNARAAWEAWAVSGTSHRNYWKAQGYRAVPVVVMERVKK